MRMLVDRFVKILKQINYKERKELIENLTYNEIVNLSILIMIFIIVFIYIKNIFLFALIISLIINSLFNIYIYQTSYKRSLDITYKVRE